MDRMERKNRERAICDFALRAIASRNGPALRIDGPPPDETERNAPAVDFLAVSDGMKWAIEHTRLTSYDGQSKSDAELFEIFGELRDRLHGHLPDGYVMLNVFPVPRLGSTRGAVLDQIDGLIRAVAHHLPVDPTGQRRHPVRYAPPDAPFPITLTRMPGVPGPSPGRLVFEQPFDLSQRCADQRVTIARALEDCCPKLAAAGADGTVLVLETNDVQLANAWLIAELIEDVGSHSPLPNHIQLVAALPEPVMAWTIKRESCWLRDLSDGFHT